MAIHHVNEIREENKIQTPPGILHSMVHLQKFITTVLGNEIKCAIIQFIFYTPTVAKTYKELYVSQVLGLSLTCRSAVRNVVASRHIKREEVLLPVAVRHPKTPELNLNFIRGNANVTHSAQGAFRILFRGLSYLVDYTREPWRVRF